MDESSEFELFKKFKTMMENKINNQEKAKEKAKERVKKEINIDRKFEKVFEKIDINLNKKEEKSKIIVQNETDPDKDIENQILSNYNDNETVSEPQLNSIHSKYEHLKGKHYHIPFENDSKITYKLGYNTIYKRKNNIVLYLKCVYKECNGSAEVILNENTNDFDINTVKLNKKCENLLNHYHNLYPMIFKYMENHEYGSIDLKNECIVELVYEWIFSKYSNYTPDEASNYFRKAFNVISTIDNKKITNIKKKIKLRNISLLSLSDRLDSIRDEENNLLLEFK